MITSANRPDFLTSDYKLKGPFRMYITGDLSAAHLAVKARDEIIDHAGAWSDWWPTIDQDLSFMALPHGHKESREQIKANHCSGLMRDEFAFQKELLVVAQEPISQAVTFLQGRATESETIHRTFFLGHEEYLGRLAGLPEIQVIDDPVKVYRWEHPDGNQLPVTRENMR